MNTPKDKQSQNSENECLDIWTYLAESEASAWQPSNLGEYKQPSLWKSTPTHGSSCDLTSQTSPSTQTSETTTQSQENSTSSQWDFLVREHQTQEVSKDSNIQLPLFGEKDLDALSKLNPSSVLWNSLKVLSDEDLELFLPPSIWQDTVGKLKQSRRSSLGLDIKDSEYLLFPTLTSGQTSTKMRPAGQVKCEKWFKDNGLIPSGYQLGTRAIALMMGFPSNWFEVLSQKNSNKKIISSQAKPQEESEQDTSQEEPLHQDKQPLPSVESSISQKLLGEDEHLLEQNRGEHLTESKISIPCLIKQPNHPELKGVIQKDLGDRFLVNTGDEAITVSKLFVYPDFSKSVGTLQGGLNKSSSKITANSQKKVSDTSTECSSKNSNPPSTKCSSKNRRKKGEGSGHIYYRTVTRNGKEYQQAYYQWRENGKQKTKYIPKKLLDKVQEAESKKLPISDILVLLGGDEKCSSKSFDTSIVSSDGQVINTSDNCSSKTTPPSTKRRKQGDGAGYIECKPIKPSGKEYKQYWYHYEFWREGDRTCKKSRYIPKRLLARVEKMEAEKVAVREILEVLGVRK